MSNLENRRFTESHEWVLEENGQYAIGITDYAQKELGDLVFINLPNVGDEIACGDAFADVESVKAVSDINSPVTGTVAEVNEALMDAPELMNQAPYESWIVKVSNVTDQENLMTLAEYEAFLAKGE